MDIGDWRGLLRHSHFRDHPYDSLGHSRWQAQPLRRLLQHCSWLWGFSGRMDQRPGGKQGRRKTVGGHRNRHVLIRKHAGFGVFRGSKHVADDGFCVCLGLFPVLHRGLALYHLFKVVQRPVIEFFSEQAVGLDHLLLIPDTGDIHEQQHEPVYSHRSGVLAGPPCLPHSQKAPPDWPSQNFPTDHSRIPMILTVSRLAILYLISLHLRHIRWIECDWYYWLV